MRLLQSNEASFEDIPCSVVGIGNFDGVHLGHQALLARLREMAAARAVPALVLTFRPHPVRVLRPQQAPELLYDIVDERRLLAQAQVDILLEEPFTPSLARLGPEEFVRTFLRDRLQARAVLVGHNFRFGRGAVGTASLLEELCRSEGIPVEVFLPVRIDGVLVSSTRIRDAVRAGRMHEAAGLLGRPFRLSGTVVRGDGRGRKLGYPTINLEPTTPMLPARGVYAALAQIEQAGPGYTSAVSIGLRPTFGGSRLTVEAHLLGFEGDLYRARVSLDLLRFLRPETRFSGIPELQEAMASDLLATQAVVAAASASSTRPAPASGPEGLVR